MNEPKWRKQVEKVYMLISASIYDLTQEGNYHKGGISQAWFHENNVTEIYTYDKIKYIYIKSLDEFDELDEKFLIHLLRQYLAV